MLVLSIYERRYDAGNKFIIEQKEIEQLLEQAVQKYAAVSWTLYIVPACVSVYYNIRLRADVRNTNCFP